MSSAGRILQLLLLLPSISLAMVATTMRADDFGMSSNQIAAASAASVTSTALSSTMTEPATTTSFLSKTAPTGQPVPLEWCELGGSSSTTTTTPVVLLHGLLGSKKNFASLAKSLGTQLETKRVIYGVDLRNHGENDSHDEASMNYVDMANDVLHWMDSQDLKEVVLVGHSMGGKVAQAVALLFPERISGLVVMDIAPVTYCPKQDPHWKAVQDIAVALASTQPPSDDAASKNYKRAMDKALRAHIPDPALRAFCLTNFDANQGKWKIPIQTIVQQLPTLAEGLLESHPPSFTDKSYHGDAFFINGGQSRFLRTSHMPVIAQFFPNHMLTTIRGAGHWVHAEAPDDTIALLKKYLDR